MNRTIEGARPLAHGGVEMRMRNRDRMDATETLDRRHGGGIERGDAVPQQIAARRAHQQRALADGKTGADAEHARLVFAVAVHFALRQRLERGPALAAGRDILPLLLADAALRRRLVARRKLRAAGGADEGRHWRFPGVFFGRFCQRQRIMNQIQPVLINCELIFASRGPHSSAMHELNDTPRADLVAAVFCALIGLIAYAGFMVH